MPNNRDSTAVSSRTQAGQQASNIAPASPFDNIFSKILLQTIDIDVTASPTPPLVEALLNVGITRWFDFVFTIDEDEIRQLTITSGHDTIPLYKYSIKTLLILRKLIDKFVYDDGVDHLDSAPYTRQAYMDLSLERRSILIQQLDSDSAPLNPGPSSSRRDTAVTIKSDTEKDYDHWHRGRCTKDDFPGLQSDKGYIVWLPKF